ncbi:Bifunctional dehydrogenase and ferrochelatase [Savitreella phatthalungensis]
MSQSQGSLDRSGKALDVTPHTFPALRPGASLLIAWQIRGRKVLLVGGGVVASGRLVKILEAGGECTVVSPASGLSDEVRWRVEVERPAGLRYEDREFRDEDVEEDEYDMVMTAIDDNPLSERICKMARARRIPVNVADVPPQCDFYFGSEVRDGPLQIVVSTQGKGPKISNLVRRRIQAAIPKGAGQAIENVGTLRSKLRERAPGVGGQLGARRMRWMIDVCERFTIPELARLTPDDMDRILEGWDGLEVPGGRRKGCPLGMA